MSCFLSTIDLYCDIGADERAEGTPRTCVIPIGSGKLRRQVPLFARYVRNNNAFIRAYRYTEIAALAEVSVDADISFGGFCGHFFTVPCFPYHVQIPVRRRRLFTLRPLSSALLYRGAASIPAHRFVTGNNHFFISVSFVFKQFIGAGVGPEQVFDLFG